MTAENRPVWLADRPPKGASMRPRPMTAENAREWIRSGGVLPLQ